MALTFFTEPFYSLSDFDRLFDEAFNARAFSPSLTQRGQNENSVSRPLRPRMDLHEDKEKNLVTATFELPGLTKENVSIDVRDSVLNVSGESIISSEHDEQGYAVRERRFGKFSRSLPLPQGIKPEEIKATMENGVLTVTFPRTTPEQAPKKITIA
ncbi:small heat shock protein [Dichomitus squalens]|uniref:Small heat shock protein n=2 Tax=Dichomitus squalens TaxID=114155 RepID=A0A4Q9NCV5_9APHY|nr:small heat shock protein [Dichomitus squalens LYAD-421 SS1]EJF58927.1 small heat shock protein [Dichomitus squalens LYAD-421 SS1]TBU24583.1 small heat shock protein [Dichomitus squalens]TBU38205.1 small heat shock protein [Dichomitus squalens]TBU51101.1 small heat shock protein [Dichomitus squalens]